MRLFALSDLHLSLFEPHLAGDETPPPLIKPMDVFGERWEDHFARMEKNWLDTVAPEDTVLIAGDISWALTLAEAVYDLAYIGSLPGKKILIKGNHDYWWSSLARLRELAPASVAVLQHSAISAGGYAICGTRGWLTPAHNDFKEKNDRKLYERELLRLEMALDQAASLRQPVIAMLHYPPLQNETENSGFADLCAAYQVRYCIYGHIHGDKQGAFEGERDGVIYLNTSMDRLNFCPLLITEGE